MNLKNWVLVETKNLKDNMIVAEDIFNNDTKLITKNTRLNSSHIKKIQYVFPIGYIEIITSSIKSDFENIVFDIPVENHKETEHIFSTISNNVDKMLSSIQLSTRPSINIVREISQDMLSEITDYTSALKSITNERKIDEYLIHHSSNVAILASMLGKWLNFSDKEILLLSYAGLLHDIGKTKISPHILDKPGALTKEEFQIIKRHPVISYDLVNKIPYIDNSVAISILMHHERIDGSGYPLGLKDDKIHKFAKILGIVDMFDAMTSNKCYNKRISPFKALEILQTNYIDKLDPIYLNTFIEKMANYYTGELVILNTREIGKIIKIDIHNIAKPLLLIKDEFIDLSKKSDYNIVDLYNK